MFFLSHTRNFAPQMSKLDAYRVDLLSSKLQNSRLEWNLDDSFFEALDGLIHCGNIHTVVDCQNTGSLFRFQISSEGVITVPCDRCLADLELRIETSDELLVKLGEEYSDEGDCVIVPETEGYINLAQFIYEFIALSMPITVCHEPGKCDESMMQQLSKHQVARSNQEDDEDYGSNADGDSQSVDDRWAALKNLKLN